MNMKLVETEAPPRPRHVLMVEDDRAVVELVREAIGPRPIQVHTALTITVAFNYLDRIGEERDKPRPDLILLDLNLPVFAGTLLLAERPRWPHWPDSPIVVLTTSEGERDHCLELGANAYIHKPATWPEWQRTVDALIARYLS